MDSKIPIHGNYHGYYAKRPSASDPRLHQLPPQTFLNARVLDVGCNEGWITCEIAQVWGANKVVGVDIDDSPVEAAWRRRRALWSSQGPPISDVEPDNTEADTRVPKRRRASSSSDTAQDAPTVAAQPRRNHFPASCEHEFGSLPIPSASDTKGKTSFPHNVSFRAADWVVMDIAEDAAGYDVVVAFSISKWIHLNQGDEGLKRFFRKVHRVLRQGGTFILEPQPWDSYAKARRMSEKLKENAKSLVLRPEDFEGVLREIGFGAPTHLGSLGEGGFARPVDLYLKV